MARPLAGSLMGFNKRKMEDRRRQAAEKEAAARRATGRQIPLLLAAVIWLTGWACRKVLE